MAANRTTLVKGPGAIKAGDTVLHDADGITAEITTVATPVTTSLLGEVDQWITNRYGIISMRPAGNVTASILSSLYPHQTPVIGSSLLGAVDAPLIVHSKSGTKITFTAAALVQPPQLRLSATQTAFSGAAQWRALLGAGKAPEDTGAFLSITTEEWSDTTYPPLLTTDLLRGAYSATWGGTTIYPRAGWTIDVQLATEAIVTEMEGEIDIVLTGVTVIARCEPVGLSESTLAGLLPYDEPQGTSIRENDLVISAGAGKLKATLYAARPLVGAMRWGTIQLRAGEVAWTAQRKLSAGVPGDLYKIEIEPGGP